MVSNILRSIAKALKPGMDDSQQLHAGKEKRITMAGCISGGALLVLESLYEAEGTNQTKYHLREMSSITQQKNVFNRSIKDLQRLLNQAGLTEIQVRHGEGFGLCDGILAKKN